MDEKKPRGRTQRAAAEAVRQGERIQRSIDQKDEKKSQDDGEYKPPCRPAAESTRTSFQRNILRSQAWKRTSSRRRCSRPRATRARRSSRTR